MVRTKRPVPRKTPLRRLRDQPTLHWPPGIAPNPAWAGPSPEVPDPSRIVLRTVELIRDENGQASHLVLTGDCHGNPYRTTLTVDRPALLTILSDTLRRCLGESIEEIGAHTVNRSLNLA